jgi:DNA-binding GntR family transcriptional regulator
MQLRETLKREGSAEEFFMNLKEKIVTSLRNAILQGEYPPGEHLTELSLCNRFQVSRTPIREALQRLEKEGFVRITPAAGARVVKLSLKETFDIYDLLIILEGAACRLAASQISESQIRKLEEYDFLFEKAMVEENVELLFDLNARFHWLITEATKNSYLIDMRMNFRRLVDRIARIFPYVPGQCEETLTWHRKIISALKGRNPALGEFVMREHLENAKKNLFGHLQGREGIGNGHELQAGLEPARSEGRRSA